MAPKKITTKNPKAASSASAEKQGEKELKVLNKRLLGKFNPADWNLSTRSYVFRRGFAEILGDFAILMQV